MPSVPSDTPPGLTGSAGSTGAIAIFPRVLLWAGLAVLVTAFLGVASVRLSGAAITEPDAPAARESLLRFEDRPDGSVAIFDARANRQIASVNGEAGFVRGALRSLARERRLMGLGHEQPFRLVGRVDGRLTLEDPVTGKRVDLESFGPTNAAAFAGLLATATPEPNLRTAASRRPEPEEHRHGTR